MNALRVSAAREEFALFNPAFVAEALSEATRGYREESGEFGFAPVVFASTTMAVYTDLREQLPATTRTYLTRFLQDTPGFPPELHRLMRGVLAPLWLGLTFGVNHGTLRLDGMHVVPIGARKRRPAGLSVETVAALTKARWCGRWLGRSGTPATVLSVLGFER